MKKLFSGENNLTNINNRLNAINRLCNKILVKSNLIRGICMNQSFLTAKFSGAVISADERQHFIFDADNKFLGVVIIGDVIYGIGLIKLKDLVCCHEFVTRNSVENLLDFPIAEDSMELWSDSWINLEDYLYY